MGRQEKEEKTCDPSAAEYQLSRWRAVCLLVKSYSFKDLYKHHGDSTVQKMVDDGDIHGLRKWLKTTKHGPLANKTVEELRMIASRLHIPYYGKISKNKLLTEILRRDPDAE